MGDRANVVIKGDNQPADLVLYTHWNGSEVEGIVANGLRNAVQAGRLGDGPYGQRIIVETFFSAHSDKQTGAGIYVGEPFEPHVVVIDLDAQQVTFDPAGNEYGPEDGTVTESVEAFIERFAPAAVLAEAVAIGPV